MERAKVTYDGIEISYNESTDRWEYEINGRSRSAQSLTNAKKNIDKPEPQDKIPFTKVEAYQVSESGKVSSYQITSIADEQYASSIYVWATGPDGRRGKDSVNFFKAATPENDALIAQMQPITEQIEALKEARAVIYRQLVKLDVK